MFLSTHPATAVLLSIGFALSLVPSAVAQSPVAGAQPDVNRLSHELAERVRHLGEDIASDLGRTPQGRHLLQDLNELAQTADEFHDSPHRTADPFQQRQTYAGIRQTWHHLRGQLAQPGVSSPTVDRAARRVDEIDAQIRQALGLRAYPQTIGSSGRDRDFARMQRLAYSLLSRAEALNSAIRAEAANLSNGNRFLRQSDRLVQASGTFYDSLQPNQRPEAVSQAFAPVAVVVDRLATDLQTVRRPLLVDQEWRSFAATESVVRQEVNARLAQPAAHVVARPVIVPGRLSPLLPLADQLVRQIDAFVQAFSRNGREVPENRSILSDALRLQADAAEFRRHVRREGYDPYRLADEFLAVDLSTQRLTRRVYRIAEGRTGPSIQLVQNIDATCERIRNVLGSPNFGPVIIPGAVVPIRSR